MPMLLDASFVCLLAIHPEARVEQRTTCAEVRCDDLDPRVADPVLMQSLLEVLGFAVANVVDGTVPSGGAEPNRAV
jgi:hypothetical protein